jgi:hypothetical protein
MKQVQVHGPHDVRLDDPPSTPPGRRDTVVRMAARGICTTDVSFVHKKLGRVASSAAEGGLTRHTARAQAVLAAAHRFSLDRGGNISFWENGRLRSQLARWEP